MDTSKSSKSGSVWVRWLYPCVLGVASLTALLLGSTLFAVIFGMVGGLKALDMFLQPGKPTEADPPPTEIPPTYCRDCVSFDAKAGQEQLRKFPAFAKVAKVLTPDQLQHAGLPHEEAARHDDGSGWPDAAPSEGTRARLNGRPHTWDQYGLCARHLEMVNCYYTCDQYKKRDDV